MSMALDTPARCRRTSRRWWHAGQSPIDPTRPSVQAVVKLNNVFTQHVAAPRDPRAHEPRSVSDQRRLAVLVPQDATNVTDADTITLTAGSDGPPVHLVP